MNSIEQTAASTASTSSPMSISGQSDNRYITKPTLVQSTTNNARPKLATVKHALNRVAAKVKRSKMRNKEKKNKDKCTANCFAQINNTENIESTKAPQTEQQKRNRIQHKQNNHNKRRCHTFDLGQHDKDGDTELNKEDKIKKLICQKGYNIEKKLADTLQGQIYRCRIVERAENLNYFHKETVVIKVTSKKLHFEGITILENGNKKRIQENIIKETELLKKLSFDKDRRNEYMTRYIDFFEDAHHFYCVMEDGGHDLFEYVVKCHNLLRKGKLQRKEWRLVCKKIFKQIIELISFLHEKHHICHLDISLENMLIVNGTILQNVHTGKISLNRDFTVKFCDFGLSEQFDPNKGFGCTKYVGKTRYKSPELWTKTAIFDARLNDIWSLGIALFMMIMGAPPLKYPDHNDDNFQLIITGNVLGLIQSWNRAKYMTPQILDLLQKMLTKESQRITLQEIKAHSWVNLI